MTLNESLKVPVMAEAPMLVEEVLAPEIPVELEEPINTIEGTPEVDRVPPFAWFNTTEVGPWNVLEAVVVASAVVTPNVAPRPPRGITPA